MSASALTTAMASFECISAIAPIPSPISASPQSSYSSLSDCASSSASSFESPILQPPILSLVVPERPNEHLAVLLPKHLWKADSLATECDRFFCSSKFSMLERRHHCRKCGGVFCAQCSNKSTRLLDTSNLDFIHPPRNVPLSTFESPAAPIIDARVCVDCYNQIYDCSPSTPELTPSSDSATDSSSCSASIRSGSPPRSSSRHSSKTRVRASHMPLPPSLGSELDKYPLKCSSTLCKATGGGRWAPEPVEVLVGKRIPIVGGKAPYEEAMEREERRERRRRENPIIRDGEFQYRFQPNEARDPILLSRSVQLSTF